MESPWYKNGTIYAIDVRVFQDSNGDGWGDFPGLTSRLDYVASLGSTCIWLLPFYPTPLCDNGYDIKDYFSIDPRVGTFDDFLTFLSQATSRGIRLIIDLVMNHTSNQHPWFLAARHSCQSDYHGYYVWAAQPHPVPKEQQTIFPGPEGSVWSYDEIADSYYYHRFYVCEPELNGMNPAVQAEIRKILNFWLREEREGKFQKPSPASHFGGIRISLV